ncbi:MAG: FAD-dependent oxidoreductase [Chitinivorax sp.]
MRDHLDVLIVGGGPVGAALALKLRDSGLDVGLIEARPDAPGADPRALALSWGSCRELDRLGTWAAIRSRTPIETVHVSQQGALGRVKLSHEEMQLPALGYVVNFGELQRALHEVLTTGGIEYRTGAQLVDLKTLAHYALATIEMHGQRQQVTAALVVLADGGRSVELVPDLQRYSRPYRQQAVIADVHADRPNDGVAYERFSQAGPIALLPRGQGFALVWTQPEQHAPTVLAWDDARFLAELQQAFGDRAGQFVAAGPRAAFPLYLRQLSRNHAQRVALIGNAAQALHPVAGQGFNLGLRDALDLAQLILATPRTQIGAAPMLQQFGRNRRLDANLTVGFTDLLIQLFDQHPAWLQRMRSAGLLALDLAPGLRRAFTNRMIFGSRI